MDIVITLIKNKNIISIEYAQGNILNLKYQFHHFLMIFMLKNQVPSK